jgi:hypothetical protein
MPLLYERSALKALMLSILDRVELESVAADLAGLLSDSPTLLPTARQTHCGVLIVVA